MKRQNNRLTEEARRALRPYARRVHRRHWLRRVCLCACAGVGAGLALLAVSFFVPVPGAPLLASALAALVLFLGGLAAWFVPRRPGQLAAEIDGGGFKERVQTMVQLQGDDSPFAALQREDTLHALRAGDPKACLPLHAPKRLLALVAAGLVAGCLLGFAPNPQSAQVEQLAEVRAVMREQAERVEDLLDQLEQSTGLTDARRAELNERLRQLADQLRSGQNYKESIKQVSAIQQELGAAMQDGLQRQLEAMQSALEQQPAAQDLAQALQQANSAAQAAEAVAQAAAVALEQGPQTAQELADALREAAAQAGDEAVKQALEDLADALEAGDAAAARQALEALEEALQNAGQQGGQAAQGLSEELQMMKSRLGQLSSEGEGGAGGGEGGQSGQSGQSSQSGGEGGEGGEGGQGGQGGQGQGQGGQGSQGAQGQGQGSGTGQGQSGGQGGQGQGQGSGAGAGSGDVVESEKIYDTSRLAGQGPQVGLQGDKQEGDPGLQAEVDTGTGTLEGYIPYQQVVGDYARDAIRAAQRSQLPPTVQEWIEAYFAALQQG